MFSVMMLLADGEPQGGGLLTTMMPFLIILPLAYLLLIRPMRKQEKDRQALIGATKKNDRVITTAGIYGTVVSFGDDEVVIKVDDNVRLRMVKGSIARNLTQEEALKAQAAPGSSTATPAAKPEEHKALK
jgi:preprotein translocase subunit YajC